MDSAPVKPSVLFVCIANSCRSQMAEAVAKSLTKGRWEVWSAGSNPSGRVHPMAVQLMAELHLDLATHHSKGVTALPAKQWDYVVTMGCGDQCPAIHAKKRIDWNISDPVGLPMEQARQIRDQIVQDVSLLLAHAGQEEDRRHISTHNKEVQS